MTQMVTRCPKCSTAFRITSTQLDSAKGSVRCGSCLHIFKAKEHLVSGPAGAKTETKPAATAAKPAAAASKASAAASAPKSTFTTNTKLDRPKDSAKPAVPTKAKPKATDDDDDDMLISDDMDAIKKKESAYEFDGFIDLDMHPKQTVSLFDREIKFDDDDKEEEEPADESWAHQLLEDDETHSRQQKAAAKSQEPAPVAKKEAAPAKKAEPAKAAPKSTDQRGAPVFSLITDPHAQDPDFSDAFISATTPNQSSRKTNIEEIEAFGTSLFDTSEEEPDKSSSKRQSKTSSKMHAFDTSRAALLMNIIPAPVEFTAKRVRRWYQKKLWPTLALLAAVVLFAQVAYFKFGYFSRVEPYRSVYAFACPIVGCKLPALVDTHQIVATQLIVRNHPKVANALMVDAILINNAPFEQPFPDLLLAFSTMEDTPVALRRFKPKEYLAGELAGMDHMPMHTPVHITLELADPGADAVNYHMSIP